MELFRSKLISEHKILIDQLEKVYQNRINALLKQKAIIHGEIQRTFYENLFAINQQITNTNVFSPSNNSIQSIESNIKQEPNILDNMQPDQESIAIPQTLSKQKYGGLNESNPKNSKDDMESDEETVSEVDESLVIKTFSCNSCTKSYTEKMSLKRHIRQVHTANKDQPYHCRYCDYGCINKSRLKAHEATHMTQKPFPCNQCNKTCATKTSLRLHVINNHTANEDKPYHCTLCNYGCGTKYQLTQHEATHLPPTQKPFQCNQCNKTFVRKCHLNYHKINKHTLTKDKPFQCKLCNYGSATKQRLTRHEAAVHSNKKTFKCSFCSYRSKGKRDLKNHEMTHHGKDKKLFECEHCSYSSTRKKKLEEHKVIHENEKQYECLICWKKFSKKKRCKKHMKKHSKTDD